MPKINLLYFGYLADAAGTRGGTIDLPDHVDDSERLIEWLGAELGAQLSQPSVRLVLNNEMRTGKVPIRAGDEIGFIPPMSGG